MMMLTEAISLWRQKKISDPIFASIYFLCKAQMRDASLLARKTSKDIKIDSSEIEKILNTSMASNSPEALIALFTTQRIKKYSYRVGDTLLHWLKGLWDLELYDYIPSAETVLSRQCEGFRPITVIVDDTLWHKPVGDHEDELDFMVHDLEHAANFNKTPIWKKSQVVFFRDMQRILSVLEPLLKSERFRDKFEYLVSDMNSHVLHLMLYLRACVLEHFDDRELYLRTLGQIADQLSYRDQVRDYFLHFEKRPRLEASIVLTNYYENSSEYQNSPQNENALEFAH